MLAGAALVLKTNFFIRTNRARVVSKNSQRDAPQIEFCKSITQQNMHCVCAIAFAPIFAVTDKDAYKSLASIPGDNIQVGAANQFVIRQRANTKGVEIG